jgi:hypothetical protein
LQNFLNIIAGFFQDYLRVLPGFLKRFPKFIRVFPRFFQDFLWVFPILVKIFQDFHSISPGFREPRVDVMLDDLGSNPGVNVFRPRVIVC